MKRLVFLITTLAVLAWSSTTFANNNPDFILVYDNGYSKHYVVMKVGPNGQMVPWE